MEVRAPSNPIILVVMLIAGLATTGYGVYEYQAQNSALENAEEVDVTIISKGVESHSARRGVDYRPTVEFSYSYEQQEYTGEKIFPGTSVNDFNTQEAARQQITNYTEGETTTAYVNPENPGNAFLKHQSTNTPYIMTLIGLFITVLSSYKAITR